MKKLLLVTFSLMFGIINAQEPTEKALPKNEIKINALTTILGIPEFTYERVINEESSTGISIGFATEPEINTRFMLTPYYRFYFGKKPAAGFFVEGFGMVNTIKIYKYQYFYNNSYNPVFTSSYTTSEDKYTDFALGFGIGAKWMTKKGVIFELNSGVGRNLLNGDKNEFYDKEIVGRGGLSIGYRF